MFAILIHCKWFLSSNEFKVNGKLENAVEIKLPPSSLQVQNIIDIPNAVIFMKVLGNPKQ